MEVMLSEACPVFVSVTIWAVLVEPVSCEANVRLAGDRDTAGAAAATVTVAAEEVLALKFASPANLAVRLSAPTGSEVMFSVATPLVSVPSPRLPPPWRR